MAHSVSEQAARAVKNSERKQAVETRTPEAILLGIRGNLVAHLSITPSDIAFLLAAYDAAHALTVQSKNVITLATAAAELANEEILNLRATIVELHERIDRQAATIKEQMDQIDRYRAGVVDHIQDEIIVELPAQVYDALTSLEDHGGEA